ncbi:MAG: 16S rRNA (cytosine967-C5)-methyltransferase [Myxococcota bacterium]|jgi:16S rRNA (cytosine967-C5)-methyltransferase
MTDSSNSLISPRSIKPSKKRRSRGAGSHTSRGLAAQVLLDVELHLDRFAPDLLSDALARTNDWDPRDRALATELVYGCLRQQRRLDYTLAPLVRQGLDRVEPIARVLLRLGVYQIYCLDKIPGPIAVSSIQDAAREGGAGRLTPLLNGVLRKVVGTPEGLPTGKDIDSIGVRTSLPNWVVAQLIEAYGDDAELEGLALRSRPPLTVRPTLNKGGADATTAALEAEGFRTTPAPHGTLTISGPGDPFSTAAFKAGHFVPQDPASVAVMDFMGDVANIRVADLCAGRGVKSTGLADRGATVVAVDIAKKKLDSLERLARRLGVGESITTRAEDVSEPGAWTTELGTFDRVLVDAPCSGLGTIRKHPEIAWRRMSTDLVPLVALQKRLLAAAAACVAPGGELVYAVCSFARAEGEVATPAGFEEVDRLDLRPSAGMDAFQARRFRKSP